MVSVLRTERGERVDQPDLEHAAETSQLDLAAELGAMLLVGDDAGTKARIISGFRTRVSGSEVIVESQYTEGGVAINGSALLGQRDRGRIRYALITPSAPSNRHVDIGSFPTTPSQGNVPYGVYLRFVLDETAVQNRAFWNPIAQPPIEFPRSLPTRRTGTWDIVIEVAQPGEEWLKIAEVTKAAGGALTLSADLRNFLFEGKTPYSVLDDEWGGGNDRNGNRGLYGVKGFARFASAVRRQLQDIIGGAANDQPWWYIAPPAEGGLWHIAQNLLRRDGTKSILGSLIPEIDADALEAVGFYSRVNLGSALKRLRTIFAKSIIVEDVTSTNAALFAALAATSVDAADVTAVRAHSDDVLNRLDVQTGGQFKWAAPRRFKKSILGTSAQIIGGTGGGWVRAGSAGPTGKFSIRREVSTEAGSVVWALELPSGAVMRKLTVNGVFDTSVGGANELWVVRQPRAASGASGGEPVYARTPITDAVGDLECALSGTVIDNAAFSYFVLFSSSLDATAEIFSLEFEYDLVNVSSA